MKQQLTYLKARQENVENKQEYYECVGQLEHIHMFLELEKETFVFMYVWMFVKEGKKT